ncbi:hypothetical protein [Pseudoalteromonas sp. ASV78]
MKLITIIAALTILCVSDFKRSIDFCGYDGLAKSRLNTLNRI